MGKSFERRNELLEKLQDVLEEVQGKVDDRVVQQLVEVISILEEIDREQLAQQDHQDALQTEALLILEEIDRDKQAQTGYQDVLQKFGDFIKWLPIIIKLFEILRDLDNTK